MYCQYARKNSSTPYMIGKFHSSSINNSWLFWSFLWAYSNLFCMHTIQNALGAPVRMAQVTVTYIKRTLLMDYIHYYRYYWTFFHQNVRDDEFTNSNAKMNKIMNALGTCKAIIILCITRPEAEQRWVTLIRCPSLIKFVGLTTSKNASRAIDAGRYDILLCWKGQTVEFRFQLAVRAYPFLSSGKDLKIVRKRKLGSRVIGNTEKDCWVLKSLFMFNIYLWGHERQSTWL